VLDGSGGRIVFQRDPGGTLPFHGGRRKATKVSTAMGRASNKMGQNVGAAGFAIDIGIIRQNVYGRSAIDSFGSSLVGGRFVPIGWLLLNVCIVFIVVWLLLTNVSFIIAWWPCCLLLGRIRMPCSSFGFFDLSIIIILLLLQHALTLLWLASDYSIPIPNTTTVYECSLI
jgi:hypothetical protein